ncbi:NGO_0222 family membrane protein [Kingella oralis]|uniref:NGO_0222 family membrane protein n=1 Tax=Kingella oralis TaxID=505 RepID=UPI002D7E3698|nr:NGO_0222 family membrane protein [Kingella oralis]
MTARKRYLILTILFSLLFIALLLTGSYLVHIGSKQFGVAAFLFAFGTVMGQFTSLALYIRQISREQLAKQNANNKAA